MLTAVAMAMLLLGGCGGGSVEGGNAYVKTTDRVVKAFETEFQALQASFTPVSTPRQDLRTLATLRGSVDRAVTALTQITPPATIAPLHARLVRQIQEYRAVIAGAERGFASGDPRRILAARSRFSTALAAVATKISATISAINEQLR